MAQPFVRVEASNYTSVPRVKAQGAVALARAILVALPKDAPPNVKLPARQMRADAVAVQEAYTASRVTGGDAAKRSSRAIDNEADSLHSTLERRLADYESVAAYDPDAAASAAALKTALYPRGTDFARGDMLSQWQATEEWFAVLGADGREKALRALVGGGFVEGIRAVHAEYGEAVGTTKARGPAAPKADLAAAIARFGRSVLDLAEQLVALANDRSGDDERRAGARAALRPIDDLREANARRTSRRAADPEPAPEPADPDAPLPTV